MAFIHDDFLLESPQARHLYHSFAKNEPILDYHCHLPPKDVAENRRFQNLFEIWLEGDHYKWRAMRANGVEERFCTGDAKPYDKFLAWARTVPHTLRNPLYHWTHLELLRYFGIDSLLNESTAPAVWEQANHQLATEDLSAQGILAKFQVKAVCTTDDPADDLHWHKKIAESGTLATRVLPTFRPDKALGVDRPDAFNFWVDKLGQAAGMGIRTFAQLLDALRKRHDFFHAAGGRLSDHGLNRCFNANGISQANAGRIFANARSGVAASASEMEEYGSFMMLYFGRLDAEKGWTKQLHLGARRNNNSRALAQKGPDTGFDSIGDWPQIDTLASYLDALERDNELPRMILYNLNPADNYAFAALIGNFQDGAIAGKVQFGSGWWFLDQKEAMEWQMNALSNCGLLSRFIGMLTDSRSFMSYPRHEYFRRTISNLIGNDVARGLLPDSDELLGPLLKNICFRNASEFLRLPIGEAVK